MTKFAAKPELTVADQSAAAVDAREPSGVEVWPAPSVASATAAPARSALEVRLAQLNAKIDFLMAEHAAEKQTLNAEVLRLADALAHELRDAVCAVQQLAHGLVRTQPPLTSAETRDQVTKIAHGADHLLNTLDIILERTHINARGRRAYAGRAQ